MRVWIISVDAGKTEGDELSQLVQIDSVWTTAQAAQERVKAIEQAGKYWWFDSVLVDKPLLQLIK